VIGFWWALEDCTLENGCLWAVPRSQKDGVPRRFKRKADGEPGTEFEPPEAVEWDLSDAVPLEVSSLKQY
jgi:phytanoyl-CoA hydroxylase